jgi:hypothetical protein
MGNRLFEEDEGQEALAYQQWRFSEALEHVTPLKRPLAGNVLVVIPPYAHLERTAEAPNERLAVVAAEAWKVNRNEFVAQLERRKIFSELRVVIDVHPADRRPHEYLIWNEFLAEEWDPLVHMAAPGDDHMTQIEVPLNDSADSIYGWTFRFDEIEKFVTAPRQL